MVDEERAMGAQLVVVLMTMTTKLLFPFPLLHFWATIPSSSFFVFPFRSEGVVVCLPVLEFVDPSSAPILWPFVIYDLETEVVLFTELKEQVGILFSPRFKAVEFLFRFFRKRLKVGQHEFVLFRRVFDHLDTFVETCKRVVFVLVPYRGVRRSSFPTDCTSIRTFRPVVEQHIVGSRTVFETLPDPCYLEEVKERKGCCSSSRGGRRR